MINKVCDMVGCKIHPDYKEPQQGTKIQDTQSSHSYHSEDGDLLITADKIMVHDSYKWNNIVADQTVRFSTKYIDCPIECMFCVHRKPQDMYREIIVQDAKNLLEE